jgi:hypothetical protein
MSGPRDAHAKEQRKDDAERAITIDPLDAANQEPLDGDEDSDDHLGVHALDDGLDTFEWSEDDFVPFDPEF